MWETFPSSSSTFKVINTLTGKISNKIWYGQNTIQLESWEQVIVDTLDKNVQYRLSEDKKDQHKLYKKGSDFIEISQQDPKNDEAISDTVGDRPLAIIKNEIVGRNQESSIQKKMHLGSNEVATGARLVYQVERYDGKVWNPAEQVRYIVGDDSGWINKQSQVTEKDGKIVVEKAEQGYPIVYFTDEDVKINPSKVEEGTYRIRELIEESDKEWGMLSGYIGLAESYNGSLDIKDANTFVNSNRTTTIEIAKELDVESNQDFTFTLKQVMQSKTETIEAIDEILETRIGTNIDYGIYDSKSNEEIGKGNTGITGEIKLKGNQYARLEIEDGTIWLVNEKQDTPYVLTGISGNNENTKKLSENAMIIQGRAPIKLCTLAIEKNRLFFNEGSEILKSDFNVYKVYSDETLSKLNDDEYQIDVNTVPINLDVFQIKFIYNNTDEQSVQIVEIIEDIVIEKGISITSDMVESGVINAVTMEKTVLNEGYVVVPEDILYEGKAYHIIGIEDYAFLNANKITDLELPNDIKSIKGGTFANCTSMKTIKLPDHLINLGSTSDTWGAFQKCVSLTSITIPNEVENIGGYAFNGCTNLANVNLSDSVITIGNGAFYQCSNLTEIDLSKSIIKIGSFAFYNCVMLDNVIISNETINIGNSAFNGCNSLSGNLLIPKSVDSIGENAFYDCNTLEKIIIQGKSEDGISGSPWGASDTVTIVWQSSQEGA